MNKTRAILIALIAGCLLACASQPVTDHYYSLVLAADNTASSKHDTTTHIVIGPVRLARYLQQPGLAMQISASEIQSANHHFWAEPLDVAISKVLVGDIAKRVPHAEVVRAGTGDAACQVEIEFDKFHATNESSVVSAGRFWITLNGNRNTKIPFSTSQTLTTDGYAHAVLKLRATLDELAVKIAQACD